MKHTFLHGQDTFLIFDSAQQREQAAVKQGIDVKHVLIHPQEQGWQPLLTELQAGSLFSSACLFSCNVQMRLNNKDIEAFTKILEKADPNYQVLLKSDLPLLPKHKTLLSQWFEFIPHWKQNEQQFKAWLKGKAVQYSLEFEPDAFDFLCQVSMMNPMIAANTCQLLALHDTSRVSYDDIKRIAFASTDADIFDLAVAVLQNSPNIPKVAKYLRAASTSLQLVLWALKQSTYALIAIQQGRGTREVWRQYQIRPHFTRPLEQANQQHSTQSLKQLICTLSQLDIMLKTCNTDTGWKVLLERLA